MRPTMKKVAFTHSDASVSRMRVVRWQRTVVERQHDFPVPERERLAILHRAHASVFARIEDERATDPERARRALRGVCRPDQERQQKRCGNGAAHSPVSTPMETGPELSPRMTVRVLI